MSIKEEQLTPLTSSNAPRQIHWDDLDKRKYYFFGPTLLLGVRALVYPSNLIKTRLQMQGTQHLYKGTFDGFRKIVQAEGVRGLFRGFGVNSLGIVTGNIYITIYELTRRAYLHNEQLDPKFANFAAGATASVCSQTVVVPLDIVSQNMMMKGFPTKENFSRNSRQSLFNHCSEIWRTQGIRGFYRGYVPSIATYAPSSAIWWGSYGHLYPMYYDSLPLELDAQYKQMAAQALGGGSGGFIAAVLTNPMDVIRTRAQLIPDVTPWMVAKSLVKEEGALGLMTGVTARISAMVPSGVLIISTYELVKRLSRKAESPHFVDYA